MKAVAAAGAAAARMGAVATELAATEVVEMVDSAVGWLAALVAGMAEATQSRWNSRHGRCRPGRADGTCAPDRDQDTSKYILSRRQWQRRCCCRRRSRLCHALVVPPALDGRRPSASPSAYCRIYLGLEALSRAALQRARQSGTKEQAQVPLLMRLLGPMKRSRCR